MQDWKDALALHPIARKIAIAFDAQSLDNALGAMREEWWRPHQGPYHDGGWEIIAIWAPGGNLFEQRSIGGDYAKTVAALVSPYFWEVMEQFPCDKSRVRLMRLKSGGHIFRHSDPLHEISPGLVRFHIPIRTNPDVLFVVNGQRLTMLPGEVWNVDVRFPHEVHNLGATDRVHLVLDLVRNPAVDALMNGAHCAGSGRLIRYHLRHSLPKSGKSYFHLGN